MKFLSYNYTSPSGIIEYIEGESIKAFVSSVISGYERYRRAAREGIEHRSRVEGIVLQPTMAEYDYGAVPTSPQAACFQGVMDADIYVLILGARYGWVNPQTKLAATHEEYRAAVAAAKPVLLFVQSVKKQAEQQAFEEEVSNYTSGLFRAKFKNPVALRLEVEHALERYLVSLRPPAVGANQADSAPQYSQTITGNPSLVIQHVESLKVSAPKDSKR